VADIRSLKVLLLNVTYEPITLVTARRAVVLLLSEKAEVVEMRASGEQVRSAMTAVSLPSVIKLTYYVRIPRSAMVPPLSRKAVLRRDGFRCAYCLGPADTIDHVIPRSRGGIHDWTNVVASCKKHNLLKGDRLLSELGWSLKIKPRPPKGNIWALKQAEEFDPAWTPYLASAV
jgi:5-methylcytosine-specific restriction endonuclease McrA